MTVLVTWEGGQTPRSHSGLPVRFYTLQFVIEVRYLTVEWSGVEWGGVGWSGVERAEMDFTNSWTSPDMRKWCNR